ncbi:hypothetical protein QOZ80_1AG0020120 [Eleusine coracana subsp. coracana]|nr:hypothetical protein QOZ80_1AG0020120 [Eleusine coracana subsp. coracana]
MPASTEHETRNDVNPRDIVFFVLLIVCAHVIIGATVWWFQPVFLIPSFSVKLSEVSGLDPMHSPVIHPSFDLTVLLVNPDGQLCQKNVTVTVFYGNMVLGWGSVRDFCVEKWTSTEMKATMSHADVMLTNQLRGRLASELWSGEMQVSVELRMPGHETTIQSCRVIPGQGFALCDCSVLERN